VEIPGDDDEHLCVECTPGTRFDAGGASRYSVRPSRMVSQEYEVSTR